MHTMKQIENFIVLSECESYTKAAEKLYISSSALFQQMKLLEEEIGFKLFERNKKSVQLTDSGKYMYTEFKSIIEKMNQVIETARKLEKEGPLHLKYSVGQGIEEISSIVKKYQIKYPEKELILEYCDKKEAHQQLINNKIDGYLTAESKYIRESNLEYVRVASLPIYLGVRKGSPLAKKDIIKAEDLDEQTLLLPEQGYFDSTDEYYQSLLDKNVNVKRVHVEKGVGTDLEVIRTGACRISSVITNEDCMVYKEIDTDIRFHICFVYEKSNFIKLKSFIEHVKDK